MKLKTDESGNLLTVEKNGTIMPILVREGQEDAPLDFAYLISHNKRLSDERDAAIKQSDSLKSKLEGFSEFEAYDFDQIKRALDTHTQFEHGELLQAGKLDELKTKIRQSFEDNEARLKSTHESQLQEKAEALKSATAKFESLLMQNAFNSTNALEGTIFERVPDTARKNYSDRFRVQDDRVVGLDESGEVIISRSRPGEPAEFDEALTQIISSDPNHENYRLSTGASGIGAQSGNGLPRGNAIDSIVQNPEGYIREQMKSMGFA